jgi:hypothetical protein
MPCGLFRQRDVRWKMGFVTKLLGLPAAAVLASPRLFFSKSILNAIGPRFAFMKDFLPERAQKWAPSTLLRSTDEVTPFFPPGVRRINVHGHIWTYVHTPCKLAFARHSSPAQWRQGCCARRS